MLSSLALRINASRMEATNLSALASAENFAPRAQSPATLASKRSTSDGDSANFSAKAFAASALPFKGTDLHPTAASPGACLFTARCRKIQSFRKERFTSDLTHLAAARYRIDHEAKSR